MKNEKSIKFTKSELEVLFSGVAYILDGDPDSEEVQKLLAKIESAIEE